MDGRSKAQTTADHGTIEPPRWAHGLMALAGAVLLIGPTLAVLWPR